MKFLRKDTVALFSREGNGADGLGRCRWEGCPRVAVQECLTHAPRPERGPEGGSEPPRGGAFTETRTLGEQERI